MRAIVVREFGEPSVLRLETLPDPVPGAGQVLVRLHAAGVNPVEAYIRKGAYARKPALPFTPGADGAGIITHIGSGETALAVGQRVYVTGTVAGAYGTYAELAVCSPGQVHPLPDGLTFAQGAAIGVPYGTAYRALFQRGSARAGEAVLIHGASGGVGTAALQLALAAGLVPFGTAGTAAGLDLLRRLGIAAAFDHSARSYDQAILAATAGRGVDLIIENLANVNLARDLALLAPRGRVVVVGNRGTIEIDPRQLMARDADVRGMLLFNTPPEEMTQIHAALGAALRGRTVNPVIGHEVPLADASRAHEMVMSPGAQGKIVLVM